MAKIFTSKLIINSSRKFNRLPFRAKTVSLQPKQHFSLEKICGRVSAPNFAVNQRGFAVKKLYNWESRKEISAKPKEKILNPKLIQCVKNGYTSEIKKLLHEGCDPNVKIKDELSCLGYAIDNGKLHHVKMLVHAGADINKNCNDVVQRTPLTYACLLFKKDIVKYLIKNNAHLNIGDKYGDTPLHYACLFNKDSSILKLLLLHGADTERKNFEYQTPLEFAIEFGCLDAAETLIKHQKKKKL